MSATRERNSKIKLVVSHGNFVENGADAPADVQQKSLYQELFLKAHRSHVIKAEDLKKHQIQGYDSQGVVPKTLPKPSYLIRSSENSNSPQTTLESLKQNLKTLNDLHSRLRFMLKELEEIVIDS